MSFVAVMLAVVHSVKLVQFGHEESVSARNLSRAGLCDPRRIGLVFVRYFESCIPICMDGGSGAGLRIGVIVLELL